MLYTKLLVLLRPLLLVLFFHSLSFGQCNFSGFTAVPTNGICLTDGFITVQVPGAVTCTNWQAVLTPPSGPVQTVAILSNGTTAATPSFSSLASGSYSVVLTNGVTVTPSVVVTINNSYTTPTLNPPTATGPPCTGGTDGTLTVSVTGGNPPYTYSTTVPGNPTVTIPATSHAFTAMPASVSVPFTVVDACGTVVSSSYLMPAATNAVLSYSGGASNRVQLQRNCSSAPSSCDSVIVSYIAVAAPTAQLQSHVTTTDTTIAWISINGGPRDSLHFLYYLGNQVVFDYPPGLLSTDVFTIGFVGLCPGNTLITTCPAALDDTFLYTPVTSSPIANCNNAYSVQVGTASENCNSRITHFCLPAQLVIEPQISVGVYGPPIVNDPSWLGAGTFSLPSAGNYRITATDSCHSVQKIITVNPPPTPIINDYILGNRPSILEGTSAIRVGGPDIGGYPKNVKITPTSGATSITINPTQPFQLAGSYTINFPIEIPFTSGSYNVGDLPLGEYLVELFDTCGNTKTEIVNLTVPTTYNPVFTTIVGCSNANSIQFNMNGTNITQVKGVGLYNDNGTGVIGASTHVSSLPFLVSPPLAGQFNNLPAGDYFIRFNGLGVNTVLSTGSIGMSAALGVCPIQDGTGGSNNMFNAVSDTATTNVYIVPVTIPPYENFTIAVSGVICDPFGVNTGIINTEITGGTPVYPITYTLYDASNPGVPVGSYTAANSSDPNALSYAFVNLPDGDYSVEVSSSCYSVQSAVTLSSSSFQALIETDTIYTCLSDSIVSLHTGFSSSTYNINWYNSQGANIGSGNSIDVAASMYTDYIAEIQLDSIWACIDFPIYTKVFKILPYNFFPTTDSVQIDLCGYDADLEVEIQNGQQSYIYYVTDELSDTLNGVIQSVVSGNVVLTIPNSLVPDSNTSFTVSILDSSNGCFAILDEVITFYVSPIPGLIDFVVDTVCLGSAGEVSILNSIDGINYNLSLNNSIVDDTLFFIGDGNSHSYLASSSSLELGNNYFNLFLSAPGCYDSLLSNVGYINVLDLPLVNAGSDQNLCFGDSVLLSANNAVFYDWNHGIGLNNNVFVSPVMDSTVYSVMGTDQNGCVNIDSLKIRVYPIPQVHIFGDTVLCQSEGSFSLPLAVGLNGTPPYVFGYQINGGTVNYSNTVLDTFYIQVPLSVEGVYTYNLVSIEGSSSLNCAQYQLGSVNVVISEAPNVYAGSDNQLCMGDSVQLSASGALNYFWSNGVSNNSYIYPLVDTSYIVQGIDMNGCSMYDTILIHVNPLPTASFDFATSLCEPYILNLHNTSIDSEGCTWQIDGVGVYQGCSDFSVSFSESGYYSIELTTVNIFGCEASVFYQDSVFFPPSPVADFSPIILDVTTLNTVVAYENESIGASSYEWYFGSVYSSSDPNPMYTFPEQSGTYSVYLVAISDFGCTDTIWGEVRVTEELLVFVPNTFTPDQDEFNQVFRPVLSSGVSEEGYSLQIFNRWGGLVFESKDINQGWDGTYSNQLSPDGTYVWKINLKLKDNNGREQLIGNVNLIR